jgi:hypothetical protein
MVDKPSKKVAKKAATKQAAAKPTLLAGGNPQIAKGDGDAPLRERICSSPVPARNTGSIAAPRVPVGNDAATRAVSNDENAHACSVRVWYCPRQRGPCYADPAQLGIPKRQFGRLCVAGHQTLRRMCA